jgi:surface polysaccharide O-acyltransferase-like enzyme
MPFDKIRKAIVRLLVAFALWNVVYQGYYLLTDTYVGLNWKGILSQALIGPYHFWYLYMIAGMYLITPFLRKIAEDRQLSERFIGLFLLFGFLTKYAAELPFVGSTLDTMLDSIHMQFVLGYPGYYILGYYLYRHHLPRKQEIGLYICAGILLLLAAAANVRQSVRDGAYTEWYTGYTAPNTALVASAIYTFFVKRVSQVQFSEKAVSCVTALSLHSFGVYLIHALVLDLFAVAGLKPTVLHPVLAMPLITMLAFVVTVSLVILIRKIPNVGRKIT